MWRTCAIACVAVVFWFLCCAWISSQHIHSLSAPPIPCSALISRSLREIQKPKPTLLCCKIAVLSKHSHDTVELQKIYVDIWLCLWMQQCCCPRVLLSSCLVVIIIKRSLQSMLFLTYYMHDTIKEHVAVALNPSSFDLLSTLLHTTPLHTVQRRSKRSLPNVISIYRCCVLHSSEQF